jgi:hypothetical protein
MASAIHVRGLRDLQRAFALADKTAQKELRTALRDVAEPVRADAEQLARSRITRIGEPWSQMRVGVTQSLVYIAPKQKGKRSRANRALRRPNLFDLLMGRAMEPALERNEAKIEQGIGHVLDTVGRRWESV